MLRNTLITLSDSKIGVDNNADNKADFYQASVLSTTDYYAFGMSMKERSWQSESYRYGFNGKENDTDWDVQDYGFRIYKPELGKFLSVDPMSPKYPMLTPYQFASNTPTQAIDLDGLEAYFTNSGKFLGWGNDKSAKAPVIFVNNAKNVEDAQQEKGEILKLNITEFTNRVNWAYGEGGGTASDYYATAINNASIKQGEENMYQGLTTNSSSKLTVEERKKLYFNQSGTDKKEKSKANYVTFYELVRTKDNGLNLEGVNDNVEDNKIEDGQERLLTKYARKQIRNVIVSTKKAVTGELLINLPDGKSSDLLGGGYKWCDNCEKWVPGNSKNGTTISNVKQKSAGGFLSNSYFYTPKSNGQKGENGSTPILIQLLTDITQLGNLFLIKEIHCVNLGQKKA